MPYVYDGTIGDYVLGSDVYDISAIIGDSVVLEQSEGDVATKNNEFIGEPLLKSFSIGEYAFTAQCLDLQNAVLKSVFGAMTVSSVAGAAAMPSDAVPMYALFRIRFKGSDVPDVILPKVSMNSKLFVQQLKTRASQGNIAGTSLSRNVAIKQPSQQRDQQQASATTGSVLQFSNPSTYNPKTPVLFVPKGYTPIFMHHKVSATSEVYSEVDFDSGSVVSNITLNPTTGVWTTDVSPNNNNDNNEPEEPISEEQQE